ncbi:TcdA/TcdB catalytic glycosyltransferase domain-containing protein [Pigmentibacter sp. JX0631]|uniref:TcdA/TcdB catalytic glycosyltransferase domain-containing protein n=1 Tax=Pigmentibacter sp. JX0631 TaxID=2976982 RepID=UPI00246915A1|nr:TcdA/TcdB catalytic glycosyltransferase domain-containing protein [Pigmentibacter sp. JX0631]WGL60478.1 TcdA/TcdB catalytic glycosyltransferase domain-containing protein [Pigmentibacter sp. JX0631]
MKKKLILIQKLSLSALVCFSLNSCGGRKQNIESDGDSKKINSNYGLYEKNQNLTVNVFSSLYLNGLERIINEMNPADINKIKEVLKKFSESENIDNSEKKYFLIHELLKKIPEPRFIGENKEYLKKYEALLDNLEKYYLKTATPVPKILHFVWLGGPLGETQKEYVKIWAKLNPDYKVKIWYDSEHLFTHETNKKIKEFLDYSLVEFKNDDKYQNIFSDKYIALQNDLFEKLAKLRQKKQTGNYDLERLNYIEKILYKKSKINNNLIEERKDKFNLDSKKMKEEFSNIEFEDLKNVKYKWDLLDIYDQELLLRGNFAAAGDSARAELLRKFGGVYADIDVLPAIKPLNNFIEQYDKINGDDRASRRFRGLSLAYCEQIFNHFKFLTPTRKVDNKYKNGVLKSIDYDGNLTTIEKSKFKTAIRSNLLALKELKNIENIFVKLGDVNIRIGEFKAAEDSNSFIASHPKTSSTDWLEDIKSNILRNYAKLNSFDINNPKGFFEFDKEYIKVTEKKKYKLPHKFSESDVDYYIQGYRKDSLLPDYRITVKTSGPGVFAQTQENLFPEFISERGSFYKNKVVKIATEFSLKNNKFTNATEEDVNSSWATKSKSRDYDTFGLRKVILPVSSEENILNAADLIHKKKMAEFKKTSLVKLDSLHLTDIETSEFEKVNFYLVGHAEKDNDSVKIGNLSAKELADKMLDFSEKNKNHLIDYIDIISCNPTNDLNDTKNLVSYTQELMENLQKLGIPIDIVSIRKSTIKIDENGNELSKSKLGLYEYANDSDKIYVIKKGNNEYLTINTSNIVDLIEPNNLKKLNHFNGVFKTLLSKKTQELGEFNDVLNKIKDYYNKVNIDRRDSTSSVKFSLNSSESSLNLNSSDSDEERKNSITKSSILLTDGDNKPYKKLAKYSFKGIDSLTSVTNKYNIFMTLLNTPKTLKNITTSFQQGMVLDGIRESTNFTVNNADLVLDLIKFSKGNSFWIQHSKAFNNMSRTQVGFNLASAGLDIWQAVDLYKAASSTQDHNQKIDFIVNGSLTTARAASSIGTAILLPLSAKSGPIGAAIGYTIMFSQGTYNAVRTSQELRRIGFKEEDITVKSMLSFFGQYDKSEDPAYITRIETIKLKNEVIPNILKEKNKEFFSSLGKKHENIHFFFKKMIYPDLDLYLPYTFEYTITGCGYGVCASNKTPGRRLDNETHLCLSNNMYFNRNHSSSNNLLNIHINAVNTNQHLLEKKFAGIPSVPRNNYYSQASENYTNNTIPCPSPSTSKYMIEESANLTNEEQAMLASVSLSKQANLYFLGYGDQGKHGNMIHTIIADQGSNNLYNIHPSTYMLHIIGGEKDDIFEFYDLLKSEDPEKGFIDGGFGIDTISFEGIKNNNVTISLDNKIKSIGLPDFKNIENVMGSHGSDKIYGNDLNNYLYGNIGSDEIDGGSGDDILLPGEGFDILTGGEGSDQYIISKKDLSIDNSQFKSINNYDSSMEQKMDLLILDIKNLVSHKNENNLEIGYFENLKFNKVVNIKDYFLGENYQHLIIKDLSGNQYYGQNGKLYSENSDYSKLDTVIFKDLSNINLSEENEKVDLIDNVKNVIGTNFNNDIIGNNFDNLLIGNGGYDKIWGKNGNDTISIEMNSNRKNDDSDELLHESFLNIFGYYSRSELNGGEGNDNYILNFSKLDSYENEFHVVIDNFDPNKNIDNLIINDLDFEIKSVNFSKILSDDLNINESLKIEFQDSKKKKYHIYIKKFFQSLEYQHLQIQFGASMVLSVNEINSIINTLTDENKNYTLFLDDEINLDQLKENKYYFIDSEKIDYNIYSLNYILNSKDYKFKFAKFQQNLILSIINVKDINNYSIFYIKDFFNNKIIFKNLKLEMNSKIIFSEDDFQKYTSELLDGEIQEFEIK